MECNISVKYTFATGETSEIGLEFLMKQENMTPEKATALLEFLQSDNKAEQLNDRKETRRHISLYTFDDNMNAPNPMQAPLSVEEQLIEKETLDKLLSAIDSELTPKQRERIIHSLFDGMNEPEIAAAEGVKQQAVSQSLIASMKKLKIFLDGYL